MNTHKPFRPFQIRWAERMGDQKDPYLIRWMFIFFNYSIRIHHWIRSDDKRFFHDHSSDLISIIIRGYYYNVIPDDPNDPFPDTSKCRKIKAKAWRPWFAKAKSLHYLEIPQQGAWTLLLEGRPYNKWGFIVNGSKWRPLRYFHKFKVTSSAYNIQE